MKESLYFSKATTISGEALEALGEFVLGLGISKNGFIDVGRGER
jgi:hypothetical protein